MRIETDRESVTVRLSDASIERRKWKAAKRSSDFLAGPIPVDWLRVAIHLRGKYPLAVGLAIWFRAGVLKIRTGIALKPAVLRRIGVNRFASYRAINALETAGLISVVRHRGRAPIVSILHAPEHRLSLSPNETNSPRMCTAEYLSTDDAQQE